MHYYVSEVQATIDDEGTLSVLLHGPNAVKPLTGITLKIPAEHIGEFVDALSPQGTNGTFVSCTSNSDATVVKLASEPVEIEFRLFNFARRQLLAEVERQRLTAV